MSEICTGPIYKFTIVGMNTDAQVLLQSVLNNALSSLYANDLFLIEHDVNERSISYRLATYIQEEINNHLPGWHVDCEYNRLGIELVKNHWRSKTLNLPVVGLTSDDVVAKTVYPDINIHHRGQEGEEHNLMVIEIKKDCPTDTHDFRKLEEYGRQLGYQWGIYLNIERTQTESYWWKKGVKVSDSRSVFRIV